MRVALGDRVRLRSLRASREYLIAWLALSLTVGMVVVLYLGVSLAVSYDPLLMPLDDTYIHFQYARRWAEGGPMTYFPGDPPTSGGTSLVYPPLLALGYGAGFTGWSLAYWALAIGAFSHLGAAWLVYVIGRASPFSPKRRAPGFALVMALAFALSGPFVWAALSGMETSLFTFAVLLTLYAYTRGRLGLTIFSATLAALVRPEGIVPAALTMAVLVRRTWQAGKRWQAGVCAIPFAGAAAQPLINWIATGSSSSAGLQAKSILYNTSVTLDQRIFDSVRFWLKMWRELILGRSADFGTFTSPVLAVAGLAALAAGCCLALRRKTPNAAILVLAWVVALTVAIATLDTAFWQFKRYQLPVMALFYPAAAWFLAELSRFGKRRRVGAWIAGIVALLIVAPAVFTTVAFAGYYGENVQVVRDQQVPMARWIRAHLPYTVGESGSNGLRNVPEETAGGETLSVLTGSSRVGVHDVGLMGYFSQRPLYDVVGLTLPGPAPSWRQGPGTIYEHMAHSRYRPDFFAIYPQVQGLSYLLDAGVFGEVLAEFPVALPAHNVASATDYQAVYVANWSTTRPAEVVAQAPTLEIIGKMTLVDQVDVAYLDSEAAHDYRWWQSSQPSGFISEGYTHVYHVCGLDDPDTCWATDGGRVLTGGEEFTLSTRTGQDLVLVTRVHGRTSVPFEVYVNGKRVAQRVQPGVPGRWVEVATWVPGSLITSEKTRVWINVTGSGEASDAYLPYYHWAYQGAFVAEAPDDGVPVASFGDGGTVRLLDVALDYSPPGDGGRGEVTVSATWQGPAPDAGDGIVFIHLYNNDNIDSEPVAQIVMRPGKGVLPPGNWLPGKIRDVFTLTLPEDIAPGVYDVALGLYDARTGERYPVTGDGAGPDRRLFLGEITVEEMVE